MAERAKAASRNKRVQFTTTLERLINASELTQAEMAARMGYENQNIMTMFKKGTTRVPLEKVAPMAALLGADPARMLRAWFEAYSPEALPDLETHMGPLLTPQERSWVAGLRRIFAARLPPFDSRLSATLKREVGGLL